MKVLDSLLLLCVLVSWPAGSGAREVLVVRSNGDHLARMKPGLYGALNVLDDDPSTVWCSRGTGKGAELEVVFSENVSIDKITFAIGNQSSDANFKAYSRVKRLEISEGDMMNTVELSDKKGAQPMRFDPVLSTSRLRLKMQAGYRGTRVRRTCISDIVFYEGSKALNGKAYKSHIKKRRGAVAWMDTWVSGPEYAKDRELVLGVRGTFRFTHLPNDPTEDSLRQTGPWRLKGGTLELRFGDAWVPVQAKRDDAGRLLKLKIEEGKMAGVYSRLRKEMREW